MGGTPNPGTPPDKRLKENQPSNSRQKAVADKAKGLANANKSYAKSIPVDGPRKLPPASQIPTSKKP